MKKSIVLLELIFAIVLLSIIYLTTTKFLFAINEKNRSDFATNLTKIEFETTKLFLTNILREEKNLNNISYSNKNIFYNANLLQNNVTSFEISQYNETTYKIDICINIYNDICHSWNIR